MVFDKILLAIDSSENAIRAAEKGLELQKKFGSTVVAFHSIAHGMVPKTIPLTVPTFPGGYTIPTVDYNKIRDAYIEAGEALLKDIKEMFEEEQQEIETRLILDDDPEDYIQDIVDEENFDLVVLGCQGKHSKLEELFLGTVANETVNKAACDVLIVR
ncbi:MAG: universal stress protein [Promethearchaeia archaeon]